jgi:hypothetical protein
MYVDYVTTQLLNRVATTKVSYHYETPKTNAKQIRGVHFPILIVVQQLTLDPVAACSASMFLQSIFRKFKYECDMFPIAEEDQVIFFNIFTETIQRSGLLQNTWNNASMTDSK